MIRTILFLRTETGLVEARQRLAEALRAGLTAGPLPVTATRLWLGIESVIHPSVDPGDDTSEEEQNEPGWLDLLNESEEAFPELNARLTTIAEAITEISTITETAGAEFTRLNQQGAGTGPRLAAASRWAQALDDPVSRVESHSAEYLDFLGRVDGGVSTLFDRIPDEYSEEDQRQVSEFLDTFSGMSYAAHGGLAGIGQMRDQVRPLLSLSSRVRPVLRRLVAALDRVVESDEVFRRWGERNNEIRRELGFPEWEPPE